MGDIRIIQPCTDVVTQEHLKVGTIVDLGATRNKKAVEGKKAVYVDSQKAEKATQEEVSKGKADAPQPRGRKKKVDLVGKAEVKETPKNETES